MQFVPHTDPALPFSTAVIVDGIAYMSGNIGILPDGSVPSGLERQSRLALDNMVAALKLAGCALEDVFKCTVMLADMNDWPAFNQIYLEYFPANRLPAPSSKSSAWRRCHPSTAIAPHYAAKRRFARRARALACSRLFSASRPQMYLVARASCDCETLPL